MLNSDFVNIVEIICKRTSCRTFTGEHLTCDYKKIIEEFININNSGFLKEPYPGEKIFLLEKGAQQRQMKLLYGAIKGNNSYLLTVTRDDKNERINYAYKMQKIVLKATEMGLGTCWIGYFDHDYFSDIVPDKGWVVPGVVLIGYPASKRSIQEKMVRLSANASQRLPWDRLFFNYDTSDPLNKDLTDGYKKALEMVRLAPSSSNSQPWRVYHESKSGQFHFFKKPKNFIYEKMGMHELDMGIAMAHFDMTLDSFGIKGVWFELKKENPKKDGETPLIDGLIYVISWKPI